MLIGDTWAAGVAYPVAGVDGPLPDVDKAFDMLGS